jgi:hypothetical protein
MVVVVVPHHPPHPQEVLSIEPAGTLGKRPSPVKAMYAPEVD